MSKGTTTNLELFGKIEWAKVFEENRDKVGYKRNERSKGSYEDYDGACTVDMILDDENLDKLRKAGTAKDLDNKRNMTPDGYRVKFVRKFHIDGLPSLSGPPKVAHADGTPWDIDMDGLIGNGSVGVAYVHVYVPDDGEPATTRLDGLQVIDHVPYESNYSPGPKFKDYSKSSGSSNSPTQDLDDDDIPF